MVVEEGRVRAVIESVRPEIDCGRFAIKRTTGEKVVVEADIFADGHDVVSARLLHRHAQNAEWSEVPMEPLVNDRWRGEFAVYELGQYRYTLQAWVDHFGTWQRDLGKRVEAGQEVSVDLLMGAQLVEEAVPRASEADASLLRQYARDLRMETGGAERVRRALSEDLRGLMARYPDRSFATTYSRELAVVVDRERARFSSWYELFPRSTSPKPGGHGSFKDVEARLPYVAELGFDVLYLPPIHPIGRAFRKGRNNSPTSSEGEPGSPWGIGSVQGGHKSVHPQLGTLEDFRHLVVAARAWGLEIALDIAFQSSPDHPYAQAHPGWFRHRPDGTIQYAENPPKKYQDIYPFDFETEQWREMWEELKTVFLFWIDQDVRIFRVDNPHTKPYRFWEWLIGEIKATYPEVILLSEAFTRPKVMYHLAKLGFSQSYTYFTWRNEKRELTEYFTELTRTEVEEFFRPNLWPNTPDILTEQLQQGGSPAFMIRLVLAATLGASYGIYGPAFELMENRPKEPGSEEYLDSEKYEIKDWDIDRADSLRGVIARVNRIRRENLPLQSNRNLRFHPVDNDQLICYSKATDDLFDLILVVVNLDYRWRQSGWVELPLEELGMDPDQTYQLHDLLTDARYLWHGPRNYVELDPHQLPAHVFRIRRRIGKEGETNDYE